MELKSKKTAVFIILAIIVSGLCHAQDPGSFDPFYKYDFYINKSPFYISVSTKFTSDEAGNYSFFIPDFDYLNFHPSQSVRDFSASGTDSSALIASEDIQEDGITWTVLDVPGESEFAINYRVVPIDIFHRERPFRSFYDGRKGLLFFSTTLMKPVDCRDDSIQISMNSRDIEFHRPFSIGSLEKNIYFSSSLDELSQAVIPLGKWHKIENTSPKAIINIYMDPSPSSSQLNSLTRDIKKSLSSKIFTQSLKSITRDSGILSQFIVLFYDEDEPGITDNPVLYYNNFCFVFLPRSGDYIRDLQVILYREILRQSAKLYLAGMSFKDMTELSPVNSLLTFISVKSLHKAGILDRQYYNRAREMTFLRHSYDLREHEYHDIKLKEHAPRIFSLPGILDNKANMYAKLYYLLDILDPGLSWDDFLTGFIASYQEAMPAKGSLLEAVSSSIPGMDRDTVMNLYNVIREYELDPFKFDS